jgi:hypothetical protein
MSKLLNRINKLGNRNWNIPERGENGEYYPIIRIGTHIPFGYRQHKDDANILIPIPDELDALEVAKKYVREHGYSLRQVANWLTEQTGRSISHMGLKKRFELERKRSKAADFYETYQRKAEEAAEKAKILREAVLGGRDTSDLFPESGDDSSDPEA